MSDDIYDFVEDLKGFPLETIFLLKELDRWASLYGEEAAAGMGSAKDQVYRSGIAVSERHILTIVAKLQETGAVAQLAQATAAAKGRVWMAI